jgi:hypothetical protein
VEQSALLPQSQEDQDWDGSWGRLRNIFQRHEQKRAVEESAEKSEPAEPPKPAPEQPRTIADVRRSLNEPNIKGPVKRRRSKVEYIKPEEAAKAITVSQSKPPETQSPEEPETTKMVSLPETTDTLSSASEIQAEREPALPDRTLSEKVEAAETTPAGVSDLEQQRSEPGDSVQREPETTVQLPSVEVEKQPVSAVDETMDTPEELEKNEIAAAVAAAERPEPKPKTDQPRPAVETEVDTDLTIQRTEAPTAAAKQIAESADRSTKFEASMPEPGVQSTSEIEPAPQPEPSQPPEKDEGLGQRLLGAARRLLRFEVEPVKPEPAKEQSLPMELESSSSEPLQRMPETEPASAEAIETGPVLPEPDDLLEVEDEVAAAISQAERPPEQTPSLPAVPERKASTTLSLPAPETAQQSGPLQREVYESGKTAEGPSESPPQVAQEVAEHEPEVAELPLTPERPLPGQLSQDSGADLGPVVQALPATDSIDIKRSPESQPTPELRTEAEQVSRQPVQEPHAETPPAAEESRPVEYQTADEETLMVSAPALDADQEAVVKPLEKAWPVRQVGAPEPSTPTPEAESPGPSAEPVVQRRAAGGDASAAQVERALRQVQPSVQSDSAVELVTPRRPRPIISRSPKPESPKPVAEQPPAETLAPAKTSLQTSAQVPDSESLADTTSVQRSSEEGEEGEDLPAASAGPTRAPPLGTSMVPTEIGELPSDFWQILGQKPPEQAQQVPKAKPTNGALQRTAASVSDVSSAVAQAEAPTYERPSLETFIQREWSAPAVQRREAPGLRSSQSSIQLQRSAEISPDAQESGSSPSGEVDVEKLAEAVYRQLKRRLSIERERGRGRF